MKEKQDETFEKEICRKRIRIIIFLILYAVIFGVVTLLWNVYEKKWLEVICGIMFCGVPFVTTYFGMYLYSNLEDKKQ